MVSKRFLLFRVLIAAVLVLTVPIASAENVNVTPVTTPFITIDPIGNHTIGDVFFINGTTNLPVSENLKMDIVNYKDIHSQMKDTPYIPPSGYIPGISISSDENGINRWSTNVTDTFKELESGEYLVLVLPPINHSCNTPGCRIPKASESQLFTLTPGNISTKSNILQNTFQSHSPILPAISVTSPTPTISQTTSSIQLTPTHATSLSLLLSVTALMGIVVLRLFNRKKRE